jgi:hypothetical protein
MATLRHKIELVWKNRWAGVIFIGGGAILAGCLEYRIPSPGVSVAVMGVFAALMAARTHANAIEKAAWMLLISGLLVIEVSAIRKDRREH